MESEYLPAESRARAAKRNKIAKNSSALPHVMKRLCRILEIPETQALAKIEDKIL